LIDRSPYRQIASVHITDVGCIYREIDAAAASVAAATGAMMLMMIWSTESCSMMIDQMVSTRRRNMSSLRQHLLQQQQCTLYRFMPAPRRKSVPHGATRSFRKYTPDRCETAVPALIMRHFINYTVTPV